MKEYKYKINGNLYTVAVNGIKDFVADVQVNGTSYQVEMEKPEVKPIVVPRSVPSVVKKTETSQETKSVATAGGSKIGIKTPLPGVILDVKVNVGDVVKKGQTVIVLEAMKMENNINAPKDGTVKAVNVKKGDSVAESMDLLIIE